MFSRTPLIALMAFVIAVSTAHAGDSKGEPWLKFTLTQEEQATIVKYYTSQSAKSQDENSGKKKKRLPPGLKKKLERGGELPPGWQKKVARGEVMDVQVFQRAKPLSADLIKILPPQPRGTAIVVVEGKAVRLWEATRTIIDVLNL